MSIPITVAGNLTRDLEHRVTDGGRSVATTRLAVNRRVPDGNGGWRSVDPTFLNVTIWGSLADHAAESVRKGDRIIVSGHLRAEHRTDEQGEAHSAMALHADELAVSLKWGVVAGLQKRPQEAGSRQ
jgi:single-strand DNA-binding protein